MYKTIYLKKGKEESLKRFHPWIFSGAILRGDDDIAEGDIVRVLSTGGDFLAVGHFQIGSIAVRVLSFRDIEIDDNFWTARLASALEVAAALALPTIPTTTPIVWCMARATTCQVS